MEAVFKRVPSSRMSGPFNVSLIDGSGLSVEAELVVQSDVDFVFFDKFRTTVKSFPIDHVATIRGKIDGQQDTIFYRLQRDKQTDVIDQTGSTYTSWLCEICCVENQGNDLICTNCKSPHEGVGHKSLSFNALLLTAAKEGKALEVQRLLDAGADVNAKNNDGWTPLLYATQDNNTGVACLLIRKGADVNARIGGNTAMSFASANGNTEVIELLLSKSADIPSAAVQYARTPEVRELVQRPQKQGMPQMKRILDACRLWWAIRTLRTGAARSREKAVNTLVACGGSAVAPLVGALSSFHPHELSDRYKPHDRESGLVLSFVDSDKFKSYETLRTGPIEALGRIGDPIAIDALEKVVSSSYRRELCSALNRAETRRVVAGAGNMTSHIFEPFDEKEPEAITDAAVRALALLKQKHASTSVTPGQYFKAHGSNVLLIYGQCLQCISPSSISAKCYSQMCPTGETGTFQVDRIVNVISKDEFDSAIRNL